MKKLEYSKEQLDVFFECVSRKETRCEIAKKLNTNVDNIRTLARYNGIKYLQEHYEFNDEI